MLILPFLQKALYGFECDQTVEPELGSKNYEFFLDENSTICIIPKYYPTYLIFYQHASYDIFEYYRKMDFNDYYISQSSTYIRFLPPFQIFDTPFSEGIIRSDEGGIVSFTTLVYPGMCRDGIAISTELIQTFYFGPSFSEFFQLHDAEDKCVFFSSFNIQNIDILVSNSFSNNTILVYPDFFSYQIIQGESYSTSVSPLDSSYLFRILAQNGTNMSVSISLLSQAYMGDIKMAYSPRNSHFTPTELEEFCPKPKTWYSETFCIIMIVISFVFLLVSLWLCMTSSINTSRFDSSRYQDENLTDSFSIVGPNLIN